MKQVATYREVGQTRPTASASTFIGAALGSKSAAKSVERTIFNTNQRTLRRKQQVWVCPGACARAVAASNAPSPTIGGVLLVAFVGLVVAVFLFGEEKDLSASAVNSNPQTPSASTMVVETVSTEGAENDIGEDLAPTTIVPAAKTASAGTCYLKPGTTNVIVTDWEDKTACSIELGLAER